MDFGVFKELQPVPHSSISRKHSSNCALKEYNALIEFYWSPLLVESNCDDIEKHRVWPRIVHIKSIQTHARQWIDADILIFNSFAWWMGPRNITISWGSNENPSAVQNRVSKKLVPYEIALRTWSNWMEMHTNRTKTKLFFMSPTAYHEGGTMWDTYQGCHNVSEPVFEETLWSRAMSPDMMRIIESTLMELEQRGVKVEYLNITQLSAYRDDAHPSTHRTFWNVVNKEQLNPTKFSDCLHWCLPGVPDIWNQILYAYIMKS
ncbi:hypothetical protein CASFOL_000668 [Castilleja foliolosa]|uniref:Trichome birefringence-like C-terminal domain-containing protein n=1 Tax=Castilleja foliolosa TaxID=1961234 RepID=A0ABD3EL06_9LAMI